MCVCVCVCVGGGGGGGGVVSEFLGTFMQARVCACVLA